MEKLKRNKRGITLVALVVTIVILLILAGVSLNLVLGNNGIVKKSEEARDKYSNASANEQEQLNNAGEQIDKLLGKEYEGLTITEDTPDVAFTKADGTTPGDINNLETGDIVKYGNYEYRYNCYAVYDYYTEYLSWTTDASLDGWGVSIINSKRNSTENPGELCGTIFGAKLKSMKHTFYYCTLTTAPEIPSSVTNMDGTFNSCSSLTTAPTIPSSVTNMYCTFDSCSSLTTAPEIPSSVTNMQYTFCSCINLTTAPTIPSSVTDMWSTFYNCHSLTTAPTIPSSVTNMYCTFYNCEKLQGTIEINANPTYYSQCFFYAATEGTGLVVTGSSTMLDTLIGTKSNNSNITKGQ